LEKVSQGKPSCWKETPGKSPKRKALKTPTRNVPQKKRLLEKGPKTLKSPH